MSQQNSKENSTPGSRRTPNCKCVVCGKPLYRRPSELARVRHVACMEHRAQAQVLSGITEGQQRGLALGRQKGTNHRTGYKHREESRRKCSESHKRWCAEHPDLVEARGAKTRGANHYKWNGGSSRLNTSIRTMHENRKWMDAIRARDGKCQECGATEALEAHHIVSLAELLVEHGIKNRADARKCDALWDLGNGVTLCQKCHYQIHGRHHAD